MHHQGVDWKEHKPLNPTPRDPETAIGPRTKAEGMEYAMRSRGTAAQWMSHHTVKDDAVSGAGGPLRVGTHAAAENWEKGRGQGMKGCFDYTAKEQEAPRRPARRDAQSSAGLLQQSDGEGSSLKNGCPGPVVTRTSPPSQTSLLLISS